MKKLSEDAIKNGKHAIADFVCRQKNKARLPRFLIWMNTILKGRFEDTNKVFEPPENELGLE